MVYRVLLVSFRLWTHYCLGIFELFCFQLDNFENHMDAVQKAFEGNGGDEVYLYTTIVY